MQSAMLVLLALVSAAQLVRGLLAFQVGNSKAIGHGTTRDAPEQGRCRCCTSGAARAQLLLKSCT